MINSLIYSYKNTDVGYDKIVLFSCFLHFEPGVRIHRVMCLCLSVEEDSNRQCFDLYPRALPTSEPHVQNIKEHTASVFTKKVVKDNSIRFSIFLFSKSSCSQLLLN